MQDHLADFLEDGFFGSTHAVQVRRVVRGLLVRLRPHALPLVDAFNVPDFVVDSPLGRFDGDVYNALFEQVKNAPRARGVPSYFNELIRPLTDKNYDAPTTEANTNTTP
jgi:acyl-CoA oxidase